MGESMRKFNETELYVLRKLYSRQRIEYWERRGYVPAHLIRKVSELIGRSLDDLLCDDASHVRTGKRDKISDRDFPA